MSDDEDRFARMHGQESADPPIGVQHPAIRRLIDEAAVKWGYPPPDLVSLDSAATILAVSPRERIVLFNAALQALDELYTVTFWGARRSRKAQALTALAARLVRSRLPWTDDDLAQVLRSFSMRKSGWFPLVAILRQVEWVAADRGLGEDLRQAIRHAWRQFAEAEYPTEYIEDRRLAARLAALLDDGAEKPLFAGEEWAEEIASFLARLAEPARNAWIALLRHAADC